jgi:hypothetical protein
VLQYPEARVPEVCGPARGWLAAVLTVLEALLEVYLAANLRSGSGERLDASGARGTPKVGAAHPVLLLQAVAPKALTGWVCPWLAGLSVLGVQLCAASWLLAAGAYAC